MNNAANATTQVTPPINQLMQVTALRIAAAIEELTERGFTVIAIEFSSSSKPTIQIQSCSKCAELIESGDATYYRTGGEGQSRYRTGQFKLGHVRVLWTEQGH